MQAYAPGLIRLARRPRGKTEVERLASVVQIFMANRAGSGVVAVSGGADSVALLRSLHALGRPLVVAHVNHLLRGADSDADEAFVIDLAAALNLPCRVKKVDVAALAAGENLESTARRVRYEFFAEVAGATGAAWIATGHTADDQAETVLHRIIRGTGIQGLRGIGASLPSPRASRGEGGGASPPGEGRALGPSPRSGARGEIMVIRPMLGITRAEILDFLSALVQPFREDVTNLDPRFTRNRIRHELLPLLKSFNPDIVAAIAHLAEHARDAQEVIDAVANEVLAKSERPRAGHIIVLDEAALGQSRAVIRAVLRRLWERERWPMSEMDFSAWDRAVDVAGGELAACDFPGGIAMRRAGRVVQLDSSKFQVPSSKSGS
jgi:tRNA(Ile)-lysidine synthase